MSSPPTDTFDVAIVGSGINSLICGALLAKSGKRVCIVERASTLGGCIRTERLTLPGFLHDTMSTLYPLFVTAPHYALLADDLLREGVQFVCASLPTAVVLPDGRYLVLTRDRARNTAAFDAMSPGDGAAYVRAMNYVEAGASLTFGLLGSEFWKWKTLKLLLTEAFSRGPRQLVEFFGRALGSLRDWLESDFQSEVSQALLAPWILHVGLSPDAALSGHMGRLIVFTLEQAGSPMVEGGSGRLVDAFARIIRAHGGELRTDANVERILANRGKAAGVALTGGMTIRSRFVVANVTPTQLYGPLLSEFELPASIKSDAASYRYGRGDMQIHVALNAVPQWPGPELAEVGMLHVTSGLNGVSRAINEAERGLLPADATIVVAQPVAVDPTRAPPGTWILWIQLQELPRDGQLLGDACNEIDVPADGRWTPAVREAYADRIIERLCRLIPNLRDSIIGRHALSPADLAELNINLVGGDPYSGSCSINQFMAWRPFAGTQDHRTPIDGLFHIGASTHPGPGLGGMSGFMTAQAIQRR